MSNSLEFQPYSHDYLLNKSYLNGDGEQNPGRHRSALGPRAFHENTMDRTLDWEFQKAYAGMEALLKDDE